MNEQSFDALTRRASLRTLGAAGVAAFTGPLTAAGRKKKKRKNHNGKSQEAVCLSNGSHCTKKSKKCTAKNCLNTPFTIEARWSNPATDHDTFFFVPNDLGTNLPSPYISYACHSDSGAAMHYPFAFVSQDAQGPGDEVTTITLLLDGTYEYWIELSRSSPVGDLMVTLRNPNGRALRSWSSPENASADDRGWHVFNIQGASRSITSSDALINDGLPFGAHDPSTYVCP
jgi:hypothetical protein